MVRVTLAALAIAAMSAAAALSVAANSPPSPGTGVMDPWLVFAATTSPAPRVQRLARDEIFRRCELYRFQEETPDRFRNPQWAARFSTECAIAGGIPAPSTPVALALATIAAGTIYLTVDDGKSSSQSLTLSPD